MSVGWIILFITHGHFLPLPHHRLPRGTLWSTVLQVFCYLSWQRLLDKPVSCKILTLSCGLFFSESAIRNLPPQFTGSQTPLKGFRAQNDTFKSSELENRSQSRFYHTSVTSPSSFKQSVQSLCPSEIFSHKPILTYYAKLWRATLFPSPIACLLGRP